MAGLTNDEGRVLVALQEAGVPSPERFQTFLAGLHKAYYRAREDFHEATREGLAAAGLPPRLVDSVIACQAGNVCHAGTGAPRALVLRGSCEALVVLLLLECMRACPSKRAAMLQVRWCPPFQAASRA